MGVDEYKVKTQCSFSPTPPIIITAPSVLTDFEFNLICSKWFIVTKPNPPPLSSPIVNGIIHAHFEYGIYTYLPTHPPPKRNV